MPQPKKSAPASAPPTDEAPKPEGLYPKLLLAQSVAKGVDKAGRNEDQKYNYAKAEDVIAEAQRALHEAGLVGFMRPGPQEVREVEAKSGTAGLFVTLDAELVICDPDTAQEKGGNGTENGWCLIIRAQGTGIDYPGDKAVYKAMTGAAKYAYSSALGIPFTDDPEQDRGGAGQERKASGEASPAQKRLMTTLFRRAGIADEIAKATVAHFAGTPASKSGASAILDRIADKGDGPELKVEITKLIDEAGAKPKGSDLPGPSPDEMPDPAEAEQASLEDSPFTDDPVARDMEDRRQVEGEAQ